MKEIVTSLCRFLAVLSVSLVTLASMYFFARAMEYAYQTAILLQQMGK